LFRGGGEERIRTNLFFSTGIPVCILVLKKCKKPDDVLFINAGEYFEKWQTPESPAARAYLQDCRYLFLIELGLLPLP